MRIQRPASIKFDIDKRREFINGFSKRKSERKLKGMNRSLRESHLKKRTERNDIRKHMSAEYKKSVSNETPVVISSASVSDGHETRSSKTSLFRDGAQSVDEIVVTTTIWN